MWLLVVSLNEHKDKIYSYRYVIIMSHPIIIITGGYTPRDAPVPVVITNTITECVIAGVVSSIGITSIIFFFIFNLCYKKHP